MPKKDESGKIRFFGEIDINKDGNIKSDMPAWYLDRHIEELEEGIVKKERMLERNAVATDNVPVIKEQIKKEKSKLRQIHESRPRLTDKQLDKCANAYESLKNQIRDTMPTRKEAKDGLVDPYGELKRMKTKHISINTEVAKACGVKVVDGKVTGDEANKCYQILGKALGEDTSVERLRRDDKVEAYKTTHDLVQAILEGKKIKD